MQAHLADKKSVAYFTKPLASRALGDLLFWIPRTNTVNFDWIHCAQSYLGWYTIQPLYWIIYINIYIYIYIYIYIDFFSG